LLGIFVWHHHGVECVWFYQTLLVLYIMLAVLFGLPSLRRKLVTRYLVPIFKSALPRISETEKAALEAGGIWWDADLFSGTPDWKKLLKMQLPGLNQREQDFLNGPANHLCSLMNDWQITQDRDLSKAAWDFIKKERFFGMIIGQKDDGLAFSAAGNSAVVARVASRSLAGAVTVMVPNSLGPAELILHYGTDAQKQYYLPRLARAEEIPCFALTEPEAGSDAASLHSTGVICRDRYEGKEIIGIRLNWDKRYTTLGPIATVLGLAFQLYDPEQLLGGEKDLGITCALIPTRLPGIHIGERHDPLGSQFLNGPNQGKDVFVPVDCIIGGPKMAGKGWRMLMDCLTVGRSISLPAVASAEAQLATRVASAYGLVRQQFNLPIGRFEGIEAPLARIGGINYLLLAARKVTLGAIDSGHKAAVISAIMKAYSTECARQTIIDAMDIQGGAGISLGPRNILGHTYATLPIMVTVEGANILTRTMIIFGQGAIRCHPFVQQEVQAIENNDLIGFDKALFAHLNFTVRNVVRSLVLGITRARFTSSSGQLKANSSAKYYVRQLNRLSSSFSMLADVAMGTLGGELKRRERLCGRFADALAWMYFASTVIKKFHDDGEPQTDQPFFRWACDHSLYQAQEALRCVLDDFPKPFVGLLMRPLVFPTGAYLRPPKDRDVHLISQQLLFNADLRQKMSPDLYIPPAAEHGLGQLEDAWRRLMDVQGIENRIKEAQKSKRLPKLKGQVLIDAALKANIITEKEHQDLHQAELARLESLKVDSFPFQEFLQLRS
jgi:acyl-CoA dehydrogenase